MTMQCPCCATALEDDRIEGVNVETCPHCKGHWLDQDALGKLEATAEPDPDFRVGTIEYFPQTSKLACPACGEPMETFDYRGGAIRLDACRQAHGYWLDAGEADEVEEAMHEREHDIKRSRDAEVEWGAFLYHLQHPSWTDKVKGWFHG